MLLFISVCMTGQPSNDSELQLYRVLQRANLLNYYDTFIGQGKTLLATIVVVPRLRKVRRVFVAMLINANS